MKLFSMFSTIVVAVTIVSVNAVSHAAMINVDVNKGDGSGSLDGTLYTGAAVVGSAGDIWNDLHGTAGSGNLLNPSPATLSLAALLDSSGSSTAVGVELAGMERQDGGADALLDGLFTKDGSTTTPNFTLTLSGLDSNLTYDIYLYGRSDGNNTGGRFTVEQGLGASNPTELNYTAGSSSNLADLFNANQENISWVQFSGMAPQSDGAGGFELEIFGSRNVGAADPVNGLTSWPVLSGVQVVETPEPTTSLLAVMGIVGLLGTRCRRRRG